MKTNTKTILSGLMIFYILFLPLVSAAANDSLLQPGMGMDWYRAQSPEFKNLMTWVFGGALFIVGACYILFTAFGATASHYEGTFGSQEAKARHSNTLIRNFGILILMIAVIMVGLSIFSWF
jgi:hypothetical protein